jgi:hypothetical protein
VNAKLDLDFVSISDVNGALAHPVNAAASRHAHELAARMAAVLCAHYGMPAVRAFLRNGVPPDVIKSLGS